MRKISIFLILTIIPASFLFGSGQKEPETLKIAFLPILDSLPYYIAQQEGFFEAEGLIAKAIPVNSPVERDQLMQAGEINGMLNELSSTALFNQNEIQVQTVQTVRMASDKSPVFRILASPGSGIGSVKDLAGVEIGVSKNSIIEYMTDRILEQEGLSSEEIKVKSVPVIPERFQLMMSGQIKAATLPDPLAQAAVTAGAIAVIDDTVYPEYSISVLSFHVDTVKNNSTAVNKFLRAWNKAVVKLNENPDRYRALFLEKIRVPESISASFIIPAFAEPQIPGEEQWTDVLKWLESKGILSVKPEYSESVIDRFLSE